MYDTKIFLATTSIEEFWDTSGKVLFLGEWCMRYSRREYLRSLDAIVMEPVYTEEEIPKILDYLDGVYERTLAVLSEKLNAIHGVDYSERYWRILTGTWLKQHIHMLYDRYQYISAALRSYPELTTICLDEASFQTPGTTLDHIELLKGDLYNLQIFSKMMWKLNRQFPKRKADADRHLYLQGSIHKPPVNKTASLMKIYLAKTLSAIGSKGRKIVYHNAYFPRDVQVKLLLKTKLCMSPFFYPDTDLQDRACSQEARDLIKDKSFGENEFEKLLFDFVSEEIPMIFVERYRETKNEIEKLYPFKPKAVMSATSWHYNDVFKLWAASQAQKGALLVGLQHGGGYGMLQYWLQERQELRVVDRYYSWGWKRSDSGIRALVRPLTPTKLVGRKKGLEGRKSPSILYDLTTWSRYLVQFPLTTDYWCRYYQHVTMFASALSERVRSNLRLRPHREDMGWELLERLKDIFPPDVPIETWDVPFLESLENSCLFLCGHPTYSTTFLEALYIDKPTILFYDPSFAANALHPDAVEYFESLRSAGILFESPVEAARQVNRVHSRVDEWWNELPRQKALERFRARFIKVSGNAVDEWVQELKGVLGRGGDGE